MPKIVAFVNLINTTTNIFGNVCQMLRISFFNQEGSLVAKSFKPSIHCLEFDSHLGVCDYLNSLEDEPDVGTNIGLFYRVLREHGWSKKGSPFIPPHLQSTRGKDCLEPVPQSPKIAYFRSYNMMGFDGGLFENIVRLITGNPSYDILDTMLEYCEKYGVEMERTFPSMRMVVANKKEVPVVDIRKKRKTVSFEDSLVIRMGGSCSDEDSCGGDGGDEIYDNDMIMEMEGEKREGTAEKSEKRSRANELKRIHRKERNDRKKMEKDNLATPHNRIIPISTIPLFLSMMPTHYHDANSILYECESLEISIRNSLSLLVGITKHVYDQVDTLTSNRRYLGFIYQQSFCNGLRESCYERDLLENEILQLKMEVVATKSKNNHNGLNK
jgi:hypothetical protein